MSGTGPGKQQHSTPSPPVDWLAQVGLSILCFVLCRVVVALAGSTVYNAEGEEEAIQKTTVGGSMSEGMLCDAKMLGWSGGAVGIAVQVPESFSIGSAPPATKPRGGNQAAEEPQGQAPQAEGLFEKKLTKEEKKKLAEERRKARAAKKAAKKAQEEEQG